MSVGSSEVILSLVTQSWTLAVHDRTGKVLVFEQGLSPTRVFSSVAQLTDDGAIDNETPICLFVGGRRIPKRWQVVDMLEAGKIHLADYMEE